MKVVLFCGGLGMRLREYSDSIPKPMVRIGYRPILWHIMKYYAHFGHKEFILCLGWRGDVIKEYFLHYDECLSNDFVLTNGGDTVKLLARDIQDWSVTFVDTGTTANIGERLAAVRPHLESEEMFLANYADDLTDLNLPELIAFARQQQAVATFLSVRPAQSFHTVTADGDGLVRRFEAVRDVDLRINGGYFVLRREVFDYMRDGEDLVAEPFQRLIALEKLRTMKYDGFWGCMDTYKEKERLETMYARGETPWEVWRQLPQGNGNRDQMAPRRDARPNGRPAPR